MGLFENKTGIRRYIGPKRVILLVMFGVFWVLAQWGRKHGVFSPETVFGFIDGHPVSAPLIFAGVYAASMFFLIPTLPFNLGAGFLFGPWYGSLLAAVGGFSGACLAFLLSRTALGQPLARRFDNRILDWLEERLEKSPWKVVAFTRVNPVFPSGPVNFLFGLTSLKFSTYAWATLAFQFPPTLVFAFVGGEAGTYILSGHTESLIRTAMLGCLGLTILWGLRVAARLYLVKEDGPDNEPETKESESKK